MLQRLFGLAEVTLPTRILGTYHRGLRPPQVTLSVHLDGVVRLIVLEDVKWRFPQVDDELVDRIALASATEPGGQPTILRQINLRCADVDYYLGVIH